MKGAKRLIVPLIKGSKRYFPRQNAVFLNFIPEVIFLGLAYEEIKQGLHTRLLLNMLKIYCHEITKIPH